MVSTEVAQQLKEAMEKPDFVFVKQNNKEELARQALALTPSEGVGEGLGQAREAPSVSVQEIDLPSTDERVRSHIIRPE